MVAKKATKKASKKAVSKAGVVKVFTITVLYRHDDGLSSYVFQNLTLNGAYEMAIEDLQRIIKDDTSMDVNPVEIVPYPNSIKFIKDDKDKEEEFRHYYQQFAGLNSISDSDWNTTTTTIKDGSKLNYKVEW